MRAQFTVVTAIYNVAPYIDDFLASLDRQTYGVANLEVVLVDDGSTDGSGEIAERWARTTSAKAVVLHQANAGQGAARNAGLDVSTGEWVNFLDPDDVIADDYFAEVSAFLESREGHLDMLSTRLLQFVETPEQHVDRHPLRSNFKAGNQVVDLSRFPGRIHLSGATGLLRLDRINAHGLRFDPRIRPSFEDPHLISAYLLHSPRPVVGFVATAEYYYRTRTDGSSSVQGALADVRKYTDVLRFGHLDLVHRAVSVHGAVPAWLQNTLLYDLLWYVRADSRIHSKTGSVAPEALAQFHELCCRIFPHIDVETVLGFRIVPTPLWMKLAVLSGYRGELPGLPYVLFDRVDESQRLVRARYFFTGDLPDEKVYWRGRRVEPSYAKIRSIEVLGRSLMRERVIWLPLRGTLRMELDGRPVPLSTQALPLLPYSMTGDRLVNELGTPRAPDDGREPGSRSRRLSASLAAPARRAARRVVGRAQVPTRDEAIADLTRRLARSGWARKRFADAWVLMDRLDQAQDNAEHLYRYLMRKRPGVNAWFVLDRRSPDWSRLEGEGYKLVAHGSLEWRVLLMNARHLVSSQASGYALDPLPHALYGVPKWRATFLQHGVTKDDLSRWLNPKSFDLIVTASVGEEASFTHDGTPYVFTDREVRRTGFPRHDSLLKMARKLGSEEVNRLLVMPTWRQTLSRDLPRTLSEEERYQVFRASEYAEQWLGFLGSDDLREFAESSGLRVTLLPHPNMAGYLRPSDLPEWVEVLRWADVNVQAVFARSKVLVTDYSSVAFDLAILDRSVVYFHFDRTAFFSGAQPFRRGYFDYERDGFGPVVESRNQLMEALSELASRDFVPRTEVLQRIESTFGERAGDASYRVFKAVSQLDRAVRPRIVETALEATAGVAVGTGPEVTMEAVSDEMLAGDLLSEVGAHEDSPQAGEAAEDALAEGLLRADALSEDALSEEHLLDTETLSGDALAEGPVRADTSAVDWAATVDTDIAAGVGAGDTP